MGVCGVSGVGDTVVGRGAWDAGSTCGLTCETERRAARHEAVTAERCGGAGACASGGTDRRPTARERVGTRSMGDRRRHAPAATRTGCEARGRREGGRDHRGSLTGEPTARAP